MIEVLFQIKSKIELNKVKKRVKIKVREATGLEGLDLNAPEVVEEGCQGAHVADRNVAVGARVQGFDEQDAVASVLADLNAVREVEAEVTGYAALVWFAASAHIARFDLLIFFVTRELD